MAVGYKLSNRRITIDIEDESQTIVLTFKRLDENRKVQTRYVRLSAEAVPVTTALLMACCPTHTHQKIENMAYETNQRLARQKIDNKE